MAVDDKLKFLYASLADMQSSVRAIDSKAYYLLVILLIPLTRLDVICQKITELLYFDSKISPVFTGILTFLFALSWIFSFFFVLRTIMAVHDPKQNVDGDHPESMFFPTYLYNFSFWTSIFSSGIQSSIQFNNQYKRIPDDPEVISQQLAFEQMKVSYTLSIKIFRVTCSYIIAIVWVFLGGILWFLNILMIKG